MRLDQTGQKDLVIKYSDLLTKVARQVESEYARPGGTRGHGWKVIDADDLFTETFLWLTEEGKGAEYLDGLDSAQAYIRTVMRNRANNEARRRRKANLADLSGGADPEETSSYGYLLNDVRYSSTDNPEAEVIEAETIAIAEAYIVKLLDEGLSSDWQHEVANAYYIEGLDTETIADRHGKTPANVRKTLQRARESLGDASEAGLRAWRDFRYPESRRTQGSRETVAEGLWKAIR